MKEYKAEAKHLYQTGGGVTPNPDSGVKVLDELWEEKNSLIQDTAGGVSDSMGRLLRFYVGPSGPAGDTPTEAVNLWGKSTSI